MRNNLKPGDFIVARNYRSFPIRLTRKEIGAPYIYGYWITDIPYFGGAVVHKTVNLFWKHSPATQLKVKV